MNARALDALSRIPVARVAVGLVREPSRRTDAFAAAICVLMCGGFLAIAWSLSPFGYNTDGWFLLASGREVVESGIPRENPWSFEPGLAIVVQQWAHDAWLYLWQRELGFAGVGAARAVEAAAFMALLWACLPAFCAKPGPSVALRCLAELACVACAASYMNCRPTMWSMMALLATMAVCSRGRTSPALYALLPALTVLHVNLHGAMWALDAFAAACFILPWDASELKGLRTGSNRRAWARSRAPLVAAILGMCLASLANPYGVEGSLYSLLSVGEASYGGLIQEMLPLIAAVGPASAAGVLLMLLGPVALAFARGRKAPPLPALAFLAASLAATLLHARSLWILGIAAMACALAMAAPAAAGRAGRAGAARALACCAAIALFAGTASAAPAEGASGGGGVSGDAAALSSWEAGESGIAPLAETIRSSGIEHPKVFSSTDSAWAALEWYGVPVMCDLRPEIWAPQISGRQGYYPWRDYCASRTGVDSEAAYLAGEDFDFFLVEAGDAERMSDSYGLEVVAQTDSWVLLAKR